LGRARAEAWPWRPCSRESPCTTRRWSGAGDRSARGLRWRRMVV